MSTHTDKKIATVLQSHHGAIKALASDAERSANRSEEALKIAREATAELANIAERSESKVAQLAEQTKAEQRAELDAMFDEMVTRDDKISATLKADAQKNFDGFKQYLAGSLAEVNKSIEKLDGEAKVRAEFVARALAELAEKGSTEWLLEVWQGTFRAGMQAKRGQLWTYYGTTFICVADTTKEPGVANKRNNSWAVFAASGAPGAPGTGGGTVTSLPDQTGNNGKFLTTDGSNASWAALAGGGDMVAANNLSDVANAATARSNLGLAIGTDVQAYNANTLKKVVGITIDGGGSAITTGVKGYIRFPWAGTITKATVLADASGSIVIDVWKDTYANYPPTVADTITASAKPTLSTATKSEDATLTGWTTSISAGDCIGFNVDSATTVTRVTLEIEVTLT